MPDVTEPRPATAPVQPRPTHAHHHSADLTQALQRPGSVRIDVRGAFIVDDDTSSPPRTTSPSGSPETKDIRLPHHKAAVSHIAVDIGGSLAKLVYFTRAPDGEGGKLNFKTFETEHVEELLGYMDRLVNGAGGRGENGEKGGEKGLYVMATGGGAYKYYDVIRERLGVDVYREDEMECLIVGLDFFITEIPYEVFTYSEEDPMQFAETRPDIYPYLLVNIGSGVSMIKVSGPNKFERIGGSSLGGGTLWGLLSILTDARNFDDMLALAERGDNANVDMLVGDIYGGGYGRIGLKATTIASSFGKVFKKQTQEASADTQGEVGSAAQAGVGDGGAKTTEEATGARGKGRFRQEDISRSLLYAVSNNIGQIAYLQAQNHGLEHIYFGGSFIRGHRQTMHSLSYAIRFWSKGSKQAYFLRHEGYLGAVGAFLRRQPRNWGRRNSTGEDGIPISKRVSLIMDQQERMEEHAVEDR